MLVNNVFYLLLELIINAVLFVAGGTSGGRGYTSAFPHQYLGLKNLNT
jgi:hypothetical protein